ncbi:MAG: M24 family metallopeptidase [bacterium JZ-2024 1]
MKRWEKISQLLHEKGVDGILIHSPINRFYMSGFYGTEGYLWISREGEGWLYVDFRYEEKARKVLTEGIKLRSTRFSAQLHREVMEALKEEKVQRVGFESHLVPVAEWERWKEALSGIELVGLEPLVESLRVVKEKEELENIQKACGVVESALQWLLRNLREGITEKELAQELEYQMKKKGAERLAFDPIVLFGSNTGMPHGSPSDRKLQNGDAVTIDIGAVVNGYHSDVTRSFVFGKADEEYRRCWEWVNQSKLRAQEAVKEQILGKELDAVAREFLSAKGVGEAFAHGLGHGVGLEIHEKPFLNILSEEPLLSSMVITIEPGLYFPGKWGIRLEDTYLVESRWATNLTETIPAFLEF